MKIIVVDGFKMIDPSESGALLVESDRVNEYLDYAARKKLTKISLQAYHGFKLQNIDFFKEYNFFTEVSVIQDLSEIDISGVHFSKRSRKTNFILKMIEFLLHHLHQLRRIPSLYITQSPYEYLN
jgi:hypothetical protein